MPLTRKKKAITATTEITGMRAKIPNGIASNARNMNISAA